MYKFLIVLAVMVLIGSVYVPKWLSENYVKRSDYESVREELRKSVEEKNDLSKQIDQEKKEETKAQTLTDCSIEASDRLSNVLEDLNTVGEIVQARNFFLESCLNLRGYEK